MPPTGGIYFSPPPCYTDKKHERVNLMKKILCIVAIVLILAILIPAKTQPLSLLAPWFLREIFVLYPQLFS